jgi:hypothetical protein
LGCRKLDQEQLYLFRFYAGGEERRGEEREEKRRIHNVLLLLLLLLRSSKMGGRKLGGSLTGFKMSAWVCKRELIR